MRNILGQYFLYLNNLRSILEFKGFRLLFGYAVLPKLNRLHNKLHSGFNKFISDNIFEMLIFSKIKLQLLKTNLSIKTELIYCSVKHRKYNYRKYDDNMLQRSDKNV